jgi:hypothetical protein
MIYLRWFVFEMLSLIMQYLINLPLAPLIVLFADQYGWLPWWLSWFQTFDNDLDGDPGWQTENRPYINESNKYQRWVNRFHWLWRNSCYGFSRDVLGIRFLPSDSIVIIGSQSVSNGPPGVNGLVKRYLYRDGKIMAFQWYYIRQYSWFPTKCIRINIGWKLWGRDTSYAMHVFSPSPFMHFDK